MEVSGNKFELLANYLDARFGNIYEYNMNGGDVGYDVQEWTDELRDAVKQFFLHELPIDVASRLCEPTDTARSNDSRYRQYVDELLTTLEPWEVAMEVRSAAVTAVPTLHQLISHSDTWQSEDDRLDAVTWLEAHTDGTMSRELAMHLGRWDLLQAKGPHGDIHDPRMYELVDVLTPAELLDAWKYVVGPADSDLTDDEWELLWPHLGLRSPITGEPPATPRQLASWRRNLDGIRYKLANRVTWATVPKRYGTGSALAGCFSTSRANGRFRAVYDALRGEPRAGRIVEWLEEIS